MQNLTKHLASGVLALALSAGMASAATVAITGTNTPVAGNNDFVSQLGSALNPTLTFLTNASFTLSGPARLTFTSVGAESGFVNSFAATGAGVLLETEGSVSNFLTGGFASITGIFSGGLLDALLSFSNGLGFMPGPGTTEFGVFTSGGLNNSVFFLAFDDGQGSSADDNHDDLIVRVNVAAVPIPAAGFLLIGALGGLAALRRRRKIA